MPLDLSEMREVERLTKARTERTNVIDLVRTLKALDRCRRFLLLWVGLAFIAGLLLGAWL